MGKNEKQLSFNFLSSPTIHITFALIFLSFIYLLLPLLHNSIILQYHHHSDLNNFYVSIMLPFLFFTSLQVFSFRFITLFTSLYYYAFFTSDHEGALVRISVTIFSLMTVGQWWGALIDICYPSVVHRVLMYNMKVHHPSLPS